MINKQNLKKEDLLEALNYAPNKEDRNFSCDSCSNSGDCCTGSCNHSSG